MPLHFPSDRLALHRHFRAIAPAVLLMLLALITISPAAADPGAPGDRFERLRAQDLRVATIAYRLGLANAHRCRAPLVPQPGLILHALEQYEPSDRKAVDARFALGEQVGVMAVVPDGPAQRAGIAAGDKLLAINGRALPPRADAPSRITRAAQVQALLAEELRRGPVKLRVTGPGGDREVLLHNEAGCPSPVELIADGGINGWADGERILIGDGLVQACASDDELAFVIAHEMAHNLLRHRERLAARAPLGLLQTAKETSTGMRGAEEEADSMAVALAMTAGYDLTDVELFLGDLLSQRASADTHPEAGRRLSSLRAAVSRNGQWPAGAVAEERSVNTASSDRVSGSI